ncbi:hypothetical protein, partial [Litorimonas sp.]|uniref:hypothetical protein n=1 Tax=Litorimonas sp. TaxID=1892381 RepID=UPI003A8A2E3A
TSTVSSEQQMKGSSHQHTHNSVSFCLYDILQDTNHVSGTSVFKNYYSSNLALGKPTLTISYVNNAVESENHT